MKKKIVEEQEVMEKNGQVKVTKMNTNYRKLTTRISKSKRFM